MPEEGLTFVDWVTIIILILTIVVIVIVPIIDNLVQKRYRKRNSCSALLREIEDTKEALTTEMRPITTRGNNISYRNGYLNADAYDSILHSGLYTEFEPSTQNSISNFFLNIKLRNEVLKYIIYYADDFFINDNSEERHDLWIARIRRHELIITAYENYIRNSLDSITELIEEEKP